jgi:hypothetical protein
MIKIILLLSMLIPMTVGCSTTIPEKKKRECQPECRINSNESGKRYK